MPDIPAYFLLMKYNSCVDKFPVLSSILDCRRFFPHQQVSVFYQQFNGSIFLIMSFNEASQRFLLKSKPNTILT